jgi:hypothetical protein
MEKSDFCTATQTMCKPSETSAVAAQACKESTLQNQTHHSHGTLTSPSLGNYVGYGYDYSDQTTS